VVEGAAVTASCAIKLPQRDIGAATDERADH
jgi:hypothetical protein